MRTPLYLAGDIGGTKTNLALFARSGTRLTKTAEQTYATSGTAGPSAILRTFLHETGTPEIAAACLGFAGPVQGRVVRGTNFPWTLDADQLATALNIPKFHIVNDLVALAAAIPLLAEEQLRIINRGESTGGHIGVLAVGTGLGEALLIRHQGRYTPCSSEGGHKDFAPLNETGMRLQRFLSHLYGRVSVERVLSGRGLLDLYRFFMQEQQTQEPVWLAKSLEDGDAGAVTRTALDKSDPVSIRTIAAFIDILGAEAGNVALQCLATGGIYLGGGILPKLGDLFATDRFLAAFANKGRMAPLLTAMPVLLITDSSAALLGAAAWAAGFY